MRPPSGIDDGSPPNVSQCSGVTPNDDTPTAIASHSETIGDAEQLSSMEFNPGEGPTGPMFRPPKLPELLANAIATDKSLLFSSYF
jgi:hypothetical protein